VADSAAASRVGVAVVVVGVGGDCRACRGKAKDKEWVPVIKLGRLVKDMKIKSLEEICFFSLPIQESEIIDFSWGHPSRMRF